MQQVIKGKQARPRRVLLYGTHGIGKSTWAANSPSPLVLATEDGLADIGVDRTPLLTTFQEVWRWLIDLGGDAHEYRTVVIDTLDWLEKLIWKRVAEKDEKDSVEDIGYGKGYVRAVRGWEVILQCLDVIRDRGINVVLLAHARVEKFTPPDAEAYDRWMPDLHPKASPVVQEWCDEVLFATRPVYTSTKDAGFGKKTTRAVGAGDRIVYTAEAPTHAGKRRIVLPDQLPLVWAEYQKHWPTGNGSAGDVKGVVTDGHSKQKGAKE